ncbi:HNH endonuclease [Streptosporangium carneum]|uniref:HNH endonuclease n=1 Tax=Streptosporangium carneum TaxID=47481 RepID=UPI0022F3110E|nr:HNH endonuclease signature motif containing protein [Streptosporangium carneum]
MGFESSVSDAAARFEEAARAEALFTLNSVTFAPASEKDRVDLTKVYTDRMAKNGAPGRAIYDALKLAAKRCPLCGHRDVATLDHHLPKAGYPFLSVAPANLVPACSDCNKIKSDAFPSTAEEQTLHPYFDDIDHDQWLSAEVVPGRPPSLKFFVDPPQQWSTCLTARVRHHFATFGLSVLYSVQAATELSEIAHALRIQFDVAGEEGVRGYVEQVAASRSAVHLNSWRAATYRALASSSWYCSGGFSFDW